MHHETGEGENMRARQRCRQALVITGETAEARCPKAAGGGAIRDIGEDLPPIP